MSLLSLRWPASAIASWRDALHQVAVRAQHIGAMIDERIAELRRHDALGERKADRGADALAERPRRRLHPRERMPMLGMARRLRADLAKMLQVLDRDVGVAREIEQRIEKHRAVAGRQDEPVPVGPMGRARIEFQEAGEERGRDLGATHRQAGMTRFRRFDAVDRKRADGIHHAFVQIVSRHDEHRVR